MNPIVLERFLNRMEAHSIRLLLEHHGFRVSVEEPALLGALGEVPFVELPFKLLLHTPSQLKAARTLLKKHAQGNLQGVRGVVWTCPQCQESHDPEFASCWNCGANKP